MEALLELSPRFAGSETVETDVEFPGTPELHDVNACAATAHCRFDSAGCLATEFWV
ncbi:MULTISPECIES: hypothetical protein [unclassified Nocardia]|uniref:hypothetical protein n=1 Tax=unclassified Nocardia TaxID=2637762 RepID=UPI001CE4332E|nr:MULTISPECIES: hypothetical protein [unclassified Nocardia]